MIIDWPERQASSLHVRQPPIYHYEDSNPKSLNEHYFSRSYPQ